MCFNNITIFNQLIIYMITLCIAVQLYRRSMRLTMGKHTHQKKKELLFMIILDRPQVPSGGNNDDDLDDII